MEFKDTELLEGCLYDGYHINNILVEVQREDDLYVISEPVTNVYGTDLTKIDALDEFKSMMIDLFRELTNSEGILSRNLLFKLSYLKSLLITH
jgi:hypothetical protein